MPVWCPATVVEKKVWTDGLFTLKVKSSEVLPFEPGQFLHLAVEEDEKIINRPYSVASPHGETLEFFIVVVPEGELTPRLWRLEQGDEVKVSQKGAGGFTLAKTPDAEILWLMSTGTGLAPYIAMLKTQAPWERYKKIIVVHGVRQVRDFGYAHELRALEQQQPGRFVYVQAATRESQPGVLSGRLNQCLADGSLERAAGSELRPENSAVMLCGNPDMLNSMEELLGERGLKQHRSKTPGQIVTERYW
ncbi:MAG: ferredoxin--NADP reductase [Planctomycetota bacterium]|jgi:ferredoxin--NADP+ reductase|nr:ferredoxin--NADP reductase [Blastopirellula sp.]